MCQVTDKMDYFAISQLCPSSEAFSAGIWVLQTPGVTQQNSSYVSPSILLTLYHGFTADKAVMGCALHS